MLLISSFSPFTLKSSHHFPSLSHINPSLASLLSLLKNLDPKLALSIRSLKQNPNSQMASVQYSSLRKLQFVYLVLLIFASLLVCAFSETQRQEKQFLGRRRVFQIEKENQPQKTNTTATKNQTKLIKPTTNSSKTTTTAVLNKTGLKKLNSTSKNSNSTKPISVYIKKTSDLLKPSTPKNKTTQPIFTKQSQTLKEKNRLKEKTSKQEKPQKPTKPSWIDEENEDDFVSEFRDLPSKFQQTLLPDLERISTTSKAYLTKANKEITNGVKPLVGNSYAPTIASIISCVFILFPLLLVSLIFNQIKVYFSLQKILIFIQVYLSIYFSILCLSSLATGLEPLKFFYATSQSTYVCLQVLQTLGYVLYLLLLLMYLVLVFSTKSGLGSKMLGLGQTFVGFAVGLHYYATVFHRVVFHQPPKTNWKIHGIYATCFLVICLFARAERRKKAYLEEGGEEGKKN